MSILNIVERRRSDGSLCLADDRHLVDTDDRAFPQEYDFRFDRMIKGAWPITKSGFIPGDTIVLEYANARAVYQITGPLRVPLFGLTEPPSQETIDQLAAEGKDAPAQAPIFWHDDGEGGGYLYEEFDNGVHAKLIEQSLFDAPPIDTDLRDELAAMSENERMARFEADRMAKAAKVVNPAEVPKPAAAKAASTEDDD